MENIKGKFIVFEGIDGSGKSTQSKILAEKLKEKYSKVIWTFEPTSGPIGNMIRQSLFKRIPMQEEVLAALYAADRIDHLVNEFNGIKEKIDNGYIVISDRYYFSSYAYHSAHVPMDWVIKSNSLAKDILKPDINIFLDIDPKESMRRINTKGKDKDMYENIENLKTVRDNYLKAFELMIDKEEILKISANKTVDELSNLIFEKVTNLIEN